MSSRSRKAYHHLYYLANKAKINAMSVRWAKEHADEVREQKRARYAKNRKKEQKRQREWKARNRESVSTYNKRHYAERIDAMRLRRRVYYAANQKSETRKHREWMKKHPTNNRINQHRRRLLKAGGVGSHTVAEWIALCWASGWRCTYCRKKLNIKTAIHEHRIPLSRGGSDSIQNLAVSCAPCNRRKFTLTDVEFRKRVAS